MEIKQLQVGIKSAFVKLEANNIEAVEAFVEELGKHPCFHGVETNETTRINFRDRQDWLRVQIKMDVQCKSFATRDDGKSKKAKPATPGADKAEPAARATGSTKAADEPGEGGEGAGKGEGAGEAPGAGTEEGR